MLKYLENKWVRSAIPALLIHLSIGAVYCWSLLKESIANAIMCDVSSIEFAFTIAIFFLGMSAAFGGKFVETNVKKMSFISAISYTLGLIITTLFIQFHDITGVFIGYGMVMGIGLGIGYLSPVKTLMLWFKNHKGLATGIAICGFGLSKAIWSPYIVWSISTHSIEFTLLSMATISFICISLAAYLIKKPDGWVEDKSSTLSLMDIINEIKSSTYIKIWLFFFINITCGLCIIAFEKNILNSIDIVSVSLIASLTAASNALGRFVTSTYSDYLKDRSNVYIEIFIVSAVICILSSVFFYSPLITILMLLLVNFGYGGGFSSMPALLTQYYDMKKISTIHGYILSAWAIAALASYFITQLFVYRLNLGYDYLLIALALLYAIGYGLTKSIQFHKTNEIDKI